MWVRICTRPLAVVRFAVVVCTHLICGDPSACISRQPNKLQLTSPEVQECMFGKPNVVETYLQEC